MSRRYEAPRSQVLTPDREKSCWGAAVGLDTYGVARSILLLKFIKSHSGQVFPPVRGFRPLYVERTSSSSGRSSGFARSCGMSATNCEWPGGRNELHFEA